MLAATALFGSFTDAVRTAVVDTGREPRRDADENLQYAGVLNVADPNNLVGLLIGAAVVFLFSGLAINAVARAAGAVVFEVRRQFRELPGIMDGTGSRSTARSSTSAPGTRCASWPPRACWPCSPRSRSASASASAPLGGLPRRRDRHRHPDGGLPGQLRWRLGQREEARRGRRTTAARAPTAHEATVIGDTVGDPFKDTAGPAINPLIKVMNLVSLLIAPAVVSSCRSAPTPTTRCGSSIALVAVAVIVAAVVISKRRSIAVGRGDGRAAPLRRSV